MQTQHWDAIWINGLVCTCVSGYGMIEQGAVAVKDGNIAWIGPMQSLSASADALADTVYDIRGKLLTPGLIDCHTHLIFAGNRAREFEMRLQGKSYEEIAKQGGGIKSTVQATRMATEEDLYTQTLTRAHALMASGVTTLEIKSGYGLDWETESKILRVANRLKRELPLTIKITFLGAHVVPDTYQSDPDKYVDLICDEMIPAVAKDKLADAVDVFCERIAFNVTQTERVFQAAAKHGLRVKCHAEQLSDSGSAALAAQYDALSVDHLEHLSEAGVKSLADSGTVAVILPGAFYFLREKKLPPIAALRQHEVPMAIATDCNPGTSPVTSLLLMLNMACTLFSLTPEEALLAVTAHAAQALGLQDTHGTLAVGKAADFAIWHADHPALLSYYLGNNPLYQLVKAGNII